MISWINWFNVYRPWGAKLATLRAIGWLFMPQDWIPTELKYVVMDKDND
jgi:hypothetical protein